MRNIQTAGYLITLFALVIVIYSCTPKTKQDDLAQDQDKTTETVEQTVVTEETVVTEDAVVTEETVVTEEGTAAAEEDGNYEPFPVLKASEILPPELLKSEYHEVAEDVYNDCFWNKYTITSPYGEFEAINNALLKARINEIRAIAELKEVSGGEAIAAGVVDTAIEPFKAAIYIAQRPVETVVGLPGGILSLFRKIYYAGEKAVVVTGKVIAPEPKEKGGDKGEGKAKDDDDVSSGVNYLIDWYLGTSSVERQVAKSVGVDPYTSNPELAAEIKRVAGFQRYAKVGMALVPGVPLIGLVKQVRRYIWNKDPKELREFNKKQLAKMGVREEVIEKFFQSPYYSPTYQTALVLALKKLENAVNREEIIEEATLVVSIPEAQFMVASLLLTVWFSENQSEVITIADDLEVATVITQDDRLVSIFPVDYMCWSKEIADAAVQHAEALKNFDFDKKEMWIVGGVSERARQELTALGFDVHDEIIGATGEMTGTEREEAAFDINTQIYNIIPLPEMESEGENQGQEAQ